MASAIFYNGQVVTLDEAMPSAQAVLIEEGRIRKVGTNAEILALRNENTCLRDLGGKALLPGFIDPHSHFTGVGYSLLLVNARPSPSGSCDTRAQLLDAFRRGLQERALPDGEWLIGMGYDPAAFPDQTGITRLDLDEISTEVPVSCMHVSGHMAVLNTLGLKKLGYWGDCRVPEGGTVERLPDGTPSGLITEQAFLSPEIQSKIQGPGPDNMLKAIRKANDLYASFGITTAQDSRVTEKEHQLLTAAAVSGAVRIDVVGIPTSDLAEKLPVQDIRPGPYTAHVRMGGYKIFLDGSPQGKTAWLSQPYAVPPEGSGPDYRGFPICKDTEIVSAIKICLKNDWQLHAHCNGDEACEQLIRCYEKAVRETGIRKKLRPVMIHAQTVRRDQLERMAKLGMVVSFFLDHVYYWGDYHYASVLGPDRVENISPIRWAIGAGIHCTLHQDSPVVEPNVLFSVHNAVNRRTKAGRVLGEHQKISVWEALKAVTIEGAYQIFEEDTKGSITPGKLADLVILGENPLTCDSSRLKEIPVLETIKEGITIYKSTEA